MLSHCGGPAGLRKAGKTRFTAIVKTRAPRMGARLVEQVLAALDEQSVVVPGTAAAETVLPQLADSLRDLLRQRDPARSHGTSPPGTGTVAAVCRIDTRWAAC